MDKTRKGTARLRWSLAAGMSVALVAVAITYPRRDSAPTRLPRVGELGTVEAAGRLRSVEQWVPRGSAVHVVAMRAGGGILSLLQTSPAALYEVELAAFPRPPVMGGPALLRGDSTSGYLTLGEPIGIVHVSRQGVTWIADAKQRRIVGDDIAHNRELVLHVGGGRTVTRACAVSDSTVLYVDDDRPDTVFVHRVGDSLPIRALVVPASQFRGSAQRWRALRFGGSNAAPCVMWGTQMGIALILDSTRAQLISEFVEPVPLDPWYHRAWRWVIRTAPPEYVVDATSVPGVIALLFAGQTSGARRIVDLYASDGGRYLETFVLPWPALGIAAHGERLYGLHQLNDSIVVASYVLPWRIRQLVRAQAKDVRSTPTPLHTKQAAMPSKSRPRSPAGFKVLPDSHRRR